MQMGEGPLADLADPARGADRIDDIRFGHVEFSWHEYSRASDSLRASDLSGF